MKFRLTLKNPELYEQIRDVAYDHSEAIKYENGGTEPSVEEVEEELNTFLSKWVKYGEYVTLEFDTETKTATVISTTKDH